MGKAFSSLGLDDSEEEAEVGLILHSRPNSYYPGACGITKQGRRRLLDLDSLYANSFRIVRSLHYSHEFILPPPGGTIATSDQQNTITRPPTVLFVHGRVVPSSSSSSSPISPLLSQNNTNGSTPLTPPIDLLVHTGGFGRTAYDLLQFDEWLQEVGKLAKSKLLILNPEVDVAAIQLLKRKQLLLHCSSAVGTTKIVTAAVQDAELLEKLFSEGELDGEFEHHNFSDAEIVNGKSSIRQDSCSNLDASDAGRGGIRRNTPQRPAGSTTPVWRVENGEFVQDSCAVVQQPDKRKTTSGRRNAKKSAHDHRRKSTVISNGIVLENSTVFTIAGLQICVLPSSSVDDENGQANKRFGVAEVSKSLLQSGSTPSRPDILITPTSGPLHVLDGKSQELFDFVCQVQPRLHWFNGARRTTNSVVKHQQVVTNGPTLEMLTPQVTFAEAVVLLPPPRDSEDFNEASSGRLTYVGFEDNDFTPLEKPATSTASPRSKKNVNNRRVMQSRICTDGSRGDLGRQVYGTFGDDESFTEMKRANYQLAAPVDRGTPPRSSSSLVSDWIVKPLKELVREELYGTAVEDGDLQHGAQNVSGGTRTYNDDQLVATTQGSGNKMGGKAIANSTGKADVQKTSRYRNERVCQAILMQKSTARGPGRGKEKVDNRSIMGKPTATSSTLQLLSPTGTPSNRLSCVPREKARMLQSLCSWPYQLFGSNDSDIHADSNSRVPASKKFLDMTNLWTANSTPELLNKADNDSEEDEYETVEGTVARDYKGCKKANSSSSSTSLSSRNRKKKEGENNYCGGQTGALGSISALTEELKQEFATDVRALRRKLVFEALGLVLPVDGDNENEIVKAEQLDSCTEGISQHLASPAAAGTKEQNRNEQNHGAPVEGKILKGGAQESPQGEQKSFHEEEAVRKQTRGCEMELDDDEEGTIREDAEEPSTDSETSSVVGRRDQFHADTTGIIETAEQMKVNKRSPAPDNLKYEPIFPRKFYEHESWAGRDEKKHLQYPARAQELNKSKQSTASPYNFPGRITTAGEEAFSPGRPLPRTTNLEVALNDQHYIENKLREKLLREKFNYQFRKVIKEEEDRARRNKEAKSSSAHFLSLREGCEDVDPAAALSVASTPCYHFEDPGLQVEDPEEIEKMLAECGLEEVDGKELQLHSSAHSAASLAQRGGDRTDNTGGEVDHKVLATPLEDVPQEPSRGPLLDASPCEDQEINVTSASAPARASTFIDVECRKEVEEETEHLIDLLFSSVARKVATDYKVLQKCCHAEVVTEDTISISCDKGAAEDEATDDKSAETGAREQQAPFLNPAALPRPHFVREKVKYFEKRISTVLDTDHSIDVEEPQAAPSGSFVGPDAEERTNECMPGGGNMMIVGAVAAASLHKKGEEFLQETKSKRIGQPTEVATTEVVLSSPAPEQSPCSTTTGFNTSSVYPEQSPCPSSTVGSSSARSDEVDVIKAGIIEEERPSSYASSVSEEEAGRGHCGVEENTSEGRDEDYISQVDVFTTTANLDQKPVRNSKSNKSNSLPAKQPGAALVRPQPRGHRATPSQDKSARYMGPAPTRDMTQTEASLQRLLAKDPSLYIPAATKSKNKTSKNGFQIAAEDDTKTKMKNVLCHSRSREIDTRGGAADDHFCAGEKTTEATATNTPSARPKQLSSTEFTRLPTLFIQHNGVDHNYLSAIDNQENDMVMHLVEFV
ncbi:unnamed protein product [Amoebophrya sp. A120]|nr:unnamed protein product [Amoebophrya sp. A120]|eukprot:GSA120T00012488001.1